MNLYKHCLYMHIITYVLKAVKQLLCARINDCSSYHHKIRTYTNTHCTHVTNFHWIDIQKAVNAFSRVIYVVHNVYVSQSIYVDCEMTRPGFMRCDSEEATIRFISGTDFHPPFSDVNKHETRHLTARLGYVYWHTAADGVICLINAVGIAFQ